MNRRNPILFFLAVFCFLLLTVPANHSEAEDTYFYALMTEQGPAAEMFHAHHLLYLPLMRSLFVVAESVGYSGRALPLLIGFSMLAGALAICLFSVLAGKGRRGVLFALALLFSYGFWRYSTAAEIYIPVTAVSLLSLYCLRRSEESPVFFWGCSCSAAAALLLHVIAWPLALAAIPLYFVATRRPKRAVLYLALVLSVTAAVYLVAAIGPGLTVFSDAQTLRDPFISPRAWAKGAAAWSQNILSGNFLFAFHPVAEKLQAFFPYHMLQEEVFMGQAAPGWVRLLAPVFVVPAGISVAAVGVLSLKNIPKMAVSEDRVWAGAVFIWLAGTAATALVFEPANPEMWICSLAPFWLLISRLWQAKPRAGTWLAVMTALLFMHNALGGIALVKSPSGDYCRQKAAWVADEAAEGDLILTAESHSFVTFLQYRTPAHVVDAKFITPERWQQLAERPTGRVFVFSDVIEPLPAVERRAPDAVKEFQKVAERLRPALKAVHSDRFGTVYEWIR